MMSAKATSAIKYLFFKTAINEEDKDIKKSLAIVKLQNRPTI